MIELYQFPTIRGLQMSPFCLKLETFLRMTRIPYRVISLINPAKGPLGKLPYIKDGTTIVPDSQLCIEYLSGNHRIDVDEHLTPQQRAESHAIRRMLEEGYIYSLIYARWLYEPGWAGMKAIAFKKAPPILGDVIAWMLRRKIRNNLWRNGLLRHPESVIFDFAHKDLESLNILLQGRSFILGEQPSTTDATVFAFLETTYRPDVETPMKNYILGQPALLAYCERMRKTFFSSSPESKKP